MHSYSLKVMPAQHADFTAAVLQWLFQMMHRQHILVLLLIWLWKLTGCNFETHYLPGTTWEETIALPGNVTQMPMHLLMCVCATGLVCYSCMLDAVGQGRLGGSSGRGFDPAGGSRSPQYPRGQLYEPPQHRQTAGFGGQGRIQQPAQVQQRQQHHRHTNDGHPSQQHGSESQQGQFGRGRGGFRGRHTAPRGRGRGY